MIGLSPRLYTCAVCGGHFPIDYCELLEDDEQACLPCARGERRAPREIDEIGAATPGSVSVA